MDRDGGGKADAVLADRAMPAINGIVGRPRQMSVRWFGETPWPADKKKQPFRQQLNMSADNLFLRLCQ
jgi:hypothetical protein